MMKNIYKLSVLTAIVVSVLVSSCAGEKGDIGPQGDPGVAGQNGSNGVVGAKGSTGDKGATGAPGAAGVQGEKGNTPQLSVTFTDWKPLTGFTESDSTVLSYSFTSKNSVNLVNIIPTGGVVDLDNSDGYLPVKSSTTNLPIGLLYRYFKVSEDGENFVFIDKLNKGSIDINTGTYGISNSNISITTWFYFNKSIFGGNEKSKIPTFITGLNPSVRFIFLPLSLKGRTIAVDMTNYKEVQRVYGLKD